MLTQLGSLRFPRMLFALRKMHCKVVLPEQVPTVSPFETQPFADLLIKGKRGKKKILKEFPLSKQRGKFLVIVIPLNRQELH